MHVTNDSSCHVPNSSDVARTRPSATDWSLVGRKEWSNGKGNVIDSPCAAPDSPRKRVELRLRRLRSLCPTAVEAAKPAGLSTGICRRHHDAKDVVPSASEADQVFGFATSTQ